MTTESNETLPALLDGASPAQRLAQLEASAPYHAQLVRGLIDVCAERAGDGGRILAAAMAAGASTRQAAIAAGISESTVRNWTRNDPVMRSALLELSTLSARVVEDEVTRRAFAGSEDRGSMRALEMLAKARMPEYREKHQVEMTVRHTAETAADSVIEGWSGHDAPSS